MGKLSIVPSDPESQKKDKPTAIKVIKETFTDEIIFGLCGPIGTNIHFIADLIEEIFNEEYRYNCEIKRLSTYIRKYAAEDIKETVENVTPEFLRIRNTIKGGNNLRKKFKDNSILSMITIREIAKERMHFKEKEDNKGFKSRRICYVIDSFKHMEELQLFRSVYNRLFYFIGIFSPVEIRIDNLIQKNISLSEVNELINTDSGEEITHGQQVTKTFKDSDYFLRIDYYDKDLNDDQKRI